MTVVIQIGSKQYTVANGQHIIVDRQDKAEGDTFSVPVVSSYGDGSLSDKVTAEAKVVEHLKGEKVRVVKFKSKSNYHRQYGPRQHQTKLLISVK